MNQNFLTVCEKRIILLKGSNTQSINICNISNKMGYYEYKLRIEKPNKFITKEIISSESFTTINEFILFLKEKYNAKLEWPIDINFITDDKIRKNRDFSSDLWVKKAIPTVDKVINKFIKDFLLYPYFYRCESSMHLGLYNKLISNEIFCQNAVIDKYSINLIQKEWRETFPRKKHVGFLI